MVCLSGVCWTYGSPFNWSLRARLSPCLPNAFICALSMLVRNNPECARVAERYLHRQESLGLIFPTVSHLHGVLRRHMARQEQAWSHKRQPPPQPVPTNGRKRVPASRLVPVLAAMPPWQLPANAGNEMAEGLCKCN